MRLFIAINFNNNTRSQLVALRDELRGKSEHGNFSTPENLHLTLVFLGECGTGATAAVKKAIDAVRFEPFNAAIERVGRFKHSGGDIWWAGLREDKQLMALQNEMSNSIRAAGFILETRKYSPHVTLGREVLANTAPWKIEAFGETVYTVDLMESKHIGGKLIYMPIHTIRASIIVTEKEQNNGR